MKNVIENFSNAFKTSHNSQESIELLIIPTALEEKKNQNNPIRNEA